ncbi:MAG: tRNA (adenosine(37)-N6)-threonylcarbamoyltransferase complex ATPase subunit type 1 TsaE [Bacteroidota bacterium]
MITIPNYVEDELLEIAQKLLSNFADISVWCFRAEMGAGKTTLIKKVCEILQVQDAMTSPTFSIINEYDSLKKGPIYHFDFYRIVSVDELIKLGVPEYLDSGTLCLVEWPDLAKPILPDSYLEIHINFVDDKSRSLIAQPNERHL